MSQINFTRFPALSGFADDKSTFIRAAFFMFLSVLLLFSFFLFANILGTIGYVLILEILWMFLILGIAGVLGTEFSLVLLFTSLFCQNALISAVTTYNPNNQAAFSMMLGTSFFITCLFSVYCYLMWIRNRQAWASENKVFLRWTIIFSLLVLAYSGLGLFSSDFRSVIAYARVYLGAVMFFAIGVHSGYKISTPFLVSIVRLLTVILIVWGVLELFFLQDLLEALSVLDYTKMKSMGAQSNISSVKDLMEGQTYLNFSGQFGLNLEMPRMRGPNLHPISYAYELAFCSLICFMYRFRFLATACLIMLLLVGAKGAIVLTLTPLLFYALYSVVKNPRSVLFFLISFVVIYTSLVTYYGLVSEDYHILGFVGSLRGFFNNPLGHGVGVGGNLSTQGLFESSLQDFQRYQHQGTTDFALESGFGVMLYQFGVATVLFLGFYGRLFKSIWSKVAAQEIDGRFIILPIALVFVFVNSVFQEEAFSPACLGLWLLLSGFFLARRWQEGEK